MPELTRAASVMGDAVSAATVELKRGLTNVQAVVVTVAWIAPDGTEWVAASRIPDKAPAMMAESFEESASEVRDRG